MNKFVSRFIVLLFVYQCGSYANNLKGQQQTLWLMNGKKVAVQNYRLDSSDRHNQKVFHINSKGKEKDLFADEVFSFTGTDSKEVVIYHPQPELGETFSIIEMRDFLVGLNDAKKHNVSPWLIIGGVASGLVGAFVPSPEVELGESFMPIPVGILIPTAYVGLSGVLSPNAEKLKSKTPNPNPTDTYLMGYQEGVKKKIIRNSLLSAGVGFLAGFIVVLAVN
jgi:hypothetical protein